MTYTDSAKLLFGFDVSKLPVSMLFIGWLVKAALWSVLLIADLLIILLETLQSQFILVWTVYVGLI